MTVNGVSVGLCCINLLLRDQHLFGISSSVWLNGAVAAGALMRWEPLRVTYIFSVGEGDLFVPNTKK